DPIQQDRAPHAENDYHGIRGKFHREHSDAHTATSCCYCSICLHQVLTKAQEDSGMREKYQQVSLFYNELNYVEKAAAVSLENVLLDVKELQRGMDLTRREYSMHGHNTLLKDFIQQNENKLKKLQDDAKIAQDAFDEVVKFFGENSKTTPPSVFFPVFVRFVKAYRV
ncbi:hypothetical protein QQF64_033727, partial [Cirrhinus molitorella]